MVIVAANYVSEPWVRDFQGSQGIDSEYSVLRTVEVLSAQVGRQASDQLVPLPPERT